VSIPTCNEAERLFQGSIELFIFGDGSLVPLPGDQAVRRKLKQLSLQKARLRGAFLVQCGDFSRPLTSQSERSALSRELKSFSK
jgi:hypothetical protein